MTKAKLTPIDTSAQVFSSGPRIDKVRYFSPSGKRQPDYVPKPSEPARPGALQHTEVGGRRGDDVVPYRPPEAMCVGVQKEYANKGRD